MGKGTRRQPRRRTETGFPNSPSDKGEESSKPKNNDMWILGMGFSVQGFRCFPNMAVNFFLKDGLRVSPSTAQILQNSTNFPMVGKPVYGVLSDAIRISGGHRLPYIAIGVLLQAISWLSIVFLPTSYITITTLTMILLLGNFGASIAEVANDAIVAEAGKHTKPAGYLQSFVLSFASIAGIFGNLLGGVALSQISPATMFLVFGVVLIVQLFMTMSISESSLNLPARTNTLSKSLSIQKQVSELWTALCIPEIASSIAWLAASFALVPLLFGTMFYYQTEHLKLESSVIGMSKVFGQVYVLVWSIAYNKWLRDIPPNLLLMYLQGAVATLMFCDYAFVEGAFRYLGIPDPVYVILLSGLMEVVALQFKILPFSVHIAQLCPVGCEGSLMAFVMSATALSTIVSGYLGVALANWAVVTEKDFSGLSLAIIVEVICAAVPMCWCWWISSDWESEFAELKMK